MSGPYRSSGQDDDLAYGEDYQGSRGYGDQQQGGGDRGIIGDTFKKLKSRYDQRQRPPQDFGYGSTSSSSSQQYYNPSSGGGAYSSNQPTYPGAPPQQPAMPQSSQSSGIGGKLFGALEGTVHSIGSDVAGILGKPYPPRPGSQGAGPQTNFQNQPGTQGTRNRFDSTFPGPRDGNQVKWYVDGCGYFWAVSQALESARETIWILDWWLSPELYLRRPPASNEEWRLDRVLQRAANRGVKVNIIVYKEVTQALTLSSAHTKHALEDLSPNIAVFRHPDHLPDAQTAQSSIVSALQGLKLDAAGASRLGGDALKGLYGMSDDVILYWAHHEKLCLIDSQIAFMGGLDLCFGRWDLNQHPISDAHPSDLSKIVYPGQDYNNARIMDFSEVIHPFQNKLDRTKYSRMGWSDVSICLRGPCVEDLRHHFIDRWDFIYDEKYNVRRDKRYSRILPAPGHRPGEMPAYAVGAPSQGGQPGQTQQQSSLQPGQYPAPPQGSSYTQPAWQTSERPTTPSGLSTYAPRPYGQQPTATQSSSGQQQQTFPPPPPGPPPQGQAYPQASNVQAGSYGNQQQYQPPTQSATHGAVQSTPAAPVQAAQQYQPSTQSGTYGGGGQSASTISSQASQQAYHQPSSQSATWESYQHDGTQPQAQAQAQFPPPPASQPSWQTGYQHPEGQAQTQQQFAPPPTSQTSQPTYQQQSGAAELPSQQSPPYQPYRPTEGTRGFDDQPGYDQSYGQSRGVDDYNQNYGQDRGFGGYDDQYGNERAFGSRPSGTSPGRPGGTSPGRFDKYRDEARRLRDDGRFLGGELGNIGNMVESRVSGKVSDYTGGRYGRQSSRPGSRGGPSMNCQLVRSCTKWSNGTATEHSIQNAYIDLILNAQHFVYIENQFFITATGDHQKPVKNQIGKAIVDRILRAARERQPFKIFVAMPAVPGFAGDLIEDAALGTRAIMEFQYNSICRGGHSIMEEVAKAGFNPMDYIRFYNLRSFDRINFTPSERQAEQRTGIPYDEARLQFESHLGSGYAGQGETYGQPPIPPAAAQQYQQAAQQIPNTAADRWDTVSSCYMLGGEDIRNVPWSGPPESELGAFVSEELYIHSKIMIVDDRVVICGSANLNDRSMLGTHDSEIALVISDPTVVQSSMGGRPWQASRFASSLRRQIFRKHLGLVRPQDMQQPNDNFLPVQSPNQYDWGSPEDNIVSDPMSDTFQSLWNTRARTNTDVFRKAFRAVPDDNIRTWNEYKEFYEYYFSKAEEQGAGKDEHSRQSRVLYGHVVPEDFPGGVRELKELLSKVKGTLVEMPLCFLQHEDIAKSGLGLNPLTEEVYT